MAVVPAALPVASNFVIPPIIIPGGNGGTLIIPPVGAVTPPSPVPGVPEPETWAMMMIGFALLGGLLRRRRREPGDQRLDVAPKAGALQRL
ncbi:MAG: PEPxxWA-CTERM sorting domain-containing protein [Luteimonas sp.]